MEQLSLNAHEPFFSMSLGFDGVQGQVQSLSSQNWSQWLAMRPLVLCDHKVMTFTASGEGLTYLLVDRGKDTWEP